MSGRNSLPSINAVISMRRFVHIVVLRTIDSLAGRCTQWFQKGSELVGASLQMWLVYATLIVLSEEGGRHEGSGGSAWWARWKWSHVSCRWRHSEMLSQ
jgi:hypothetical protein